MIRLKNINKQFSDHENVINAINPVSINFEAGQFVALIGPSGSGKTTLLTMLGALQKPTFGEILLDDIDITRLSEKQLGKLRFEEIGFILQTSNLIPFLTIKEQFKAKDNYARRKAKSEYLSDLLLRLEIMDIINKYPDQISGGQRQRVAIALALYNEPKIILADEPTASLDSIRALEVTNLLANIAKKYQTLVIMVTHDERLLKQCDRIFKVIDGNVIEIN